MTYNVHSCRGTDGQISTDRIADVIAQFAPDVVALQELDLGRARSGGLDQTRAIAARVEMDSHFHAALRIAEEEYGDAILSKHPMRLVRAGALPGVERQIIDETRGALWVEIRVGDVPVQVLNTHFGLGRAERRVQAMALLGPEWIGAAMAAGPTIVCGDLNSPSGRVVHSLFTARLRDAQLASPAGRSRKTFATALPFLCLDYVFVSPGIEVLHTEVPRTKLTRVASDHFPLVADLELR